MENEMVVKSLHAGVVLPGEMETDSRDEEHQEALCFTLDQLSLVAVEKADCGGEGGLVDSHDTPDSNSDTCNGVGGFVGLQMLEHPGGSVGSPSSCSPPPEYYASGGFHITGPHAHAVLGEPSSVLCGRKRSVNMTECVPVPSSEHVAEIVGRQGCKIKALRAKTNTYIKTPVRGEEPVFIVTGRREDVEMAKHEILSAAEHFSMIRASRCKAGARRGPGGRGASGAPAPAGPGDHPGARAAPRGGAGGGAQGRHGEAYPAADAHLHRDAEPREGPGVRGDGHAGERGPRARRSRRTSRCAPAPSSTCRATTTSTATAPTSAWRGWAAAGRALVPGRPLGPAPPLPGRKARSASFHSAGLALGSAPSESCSPDSPFSTGSVGAASSSGRPPAPSAEELGSSSSGATAGGHAARLPTLPPPPPPPSSSDPAGLEHPLARRAQSDPLSALSWLQAGGASFSRGSSSSSTTGYSSSCSASSLPGVRPPSRRRGRRRAMLARFKAAAGLAGGYGPGARDCYVCFESEVMAALVPCGHNLFCMDCAGQICQSAEPECPVCHTPATQCIRIFS
ncbi:hypothetical protein ANANG_G00092240 [Anguilla anguilla]|uniref:RING-type domain-containing protein n=1 Tax=Anguilla anguilla TaxID=7936 RepID=A0A9D3MNY1_ANGAN|nr:hypothetical protein ANANG_G00092240 [Anguilla anguilla]